MHGGVYGIGLELIAPKNGINLSLEYQEYEMYYDAKAIGASISYKF